MKLKKNIYELLLKFIAKTVFFMTVIKLSSLCRFSFIFGSTCATFSGTSATVPLAGACAGGLVSFAMFALALIARYLFFGICSLHILAFYLPGLCAALAFSVRHRLAKLGYKLIIPIVCMILFLVHPVGMQAWAYPLFWLIPIALYFKKSKNIFFDGLASTFIAHAVGSVIFLYTVPIKPCMWNSLIPIILFERLAIASCIYVLYKLYSYGQTKIVAWLGFKCRGMATVPSRAL